MKLNSFTKLVRLSGVAFLIILSPSVGVFAAETGFVNLFNGRDMSGWEGDLKVWSVKNGAIQGSTDIKKPKDVYLIWRGGFVDNFELRFSCRILPGSPPPHPDYQGNIGVKFRGTILESNGVGGYSMVIEGLKRNSRVFHGILSEDEDRKTLSFPDTALGRKTIARAGGSPNQVDYGVAVNTLGEIKAAFKTNDWNEVTIIAQGNHIVEKVNGVVTADFTDENPVKRKLSGLLALKLYINTGPTVTAEFKDIRLKRLAVSAQPSVLAQVRGGLASGSDMTVKSEVRLFSGNDLNQFYVWRQDQGVNRDPDQVFTVRDGLLRVNVPGAFAGRGSIGYLVTKASFANYKLVAEFKWGGTSTNRNSGIFVHSNPPETGPLKCIEVDMAQDGTGAIVLIGDAQLSVGGETKTGFSGFKPTKEAMEKPLGEWNTCEIICSGRKLTVSFNGKLSTEATASSLTNGRILIQAKRGEIFFRRIDLYPLEK